MLGRKLYCVPDSSVFHVGGGTLPKNNPMKTYLNFRNNLLMLYKNLPDNELRRVMFVRSFLDYLAAFQALAAGRIGDFKAIVRARKAFKSMKPDYEDIRRSIQKNRKTGNVKGIYSFSLLWRYYVKGQKKFSDLVR